MERDEFEIGSPIDTEMNKLLKKSKQTDHFWFLRCYTNKEHLVHVVWTESNGAGGYRQLYKRFLKGKGVCCRSHHDPVTKDKESAIAVDVDGRRRRKRIQNWAGRTSIPSAGLVKKSDSKDDDSDEAKRYSFSWPSRLHGPRYVLLA